MWEYQWSNFIYNCMSTFLHYVLCKDALLDCSVPGGERCESLTWVDEIVRSLWKLTGSSAALLPRCLSNLKAIRRFRVFKTSQDLTVRRLIRYWNEALVIIGSYNGFSPKQAPSHYLSHCSLVVNRIIGKKFWTVKFGDQNTTHFIQENDFKYVPGCFKMLSILLRAEFRMRLSRSVTEW